jgi:RNA polymerase sigma factor (sigma-70 family)
MPAPHDPNTDVSLLARLGDGPDRSVAWDRFVRRYAPRIEEWCRHWGLQPADADDVVQNVLIQTAKQMERFEYTPGGSFRGWLRRVAHGAYCDFLDRRRAWHAPAGGNPAALDALAAAEARDDLLARLADEYDLELAAAAMDRVRGRVEPRTWEAFTLLAVDQLSGADAAARLGMTVGSAFAAKSKVQRLIRDEVAALDPGGDP